MGRAIKCTAAREGGDGCRRRGEVLVGAGRGRGKDQEGVLRVATCDGLARVWGSGCRVEGAGVQACRRVLTIVACDGLLRLERVFVQCGGLCMCEWGGLWAGRARTGGGGSDESHRCRDRGFGARRGEAGRVFVEQSTYRASRSQLTKALLHPTPYTLT